MHHKHPLLIPSERPRERISNMIHGRQSKEHEHRVSKALPPPPKTDNSHQSLMDNELRQEDLWILDLREQMRKSQESMQDIKKERDSLKIELSIARSKQEEAEEKDKALQAQLYEMTKNVRVTDDDFSTIIAKLGKFSGKLSNFPPNSKSAFKKELSNKELAKFFTDNTKDIDDREKESIEALFELEADKLDYSLVSVLVEKLIIAEIVDDVFDAPIHLNPIINETYKNIKELFDTSDHEAWSKDLRLKLSRATLDAMNKYPAADKLHSEKRSALIDGIVVKLAKIYNQPDEIKARVEKLVDMAIELSLPIRGQDDLLKIYKLYPGAEVYSNQVRPIYRHLNKDKIYLGITPVFLANSITDDEYNIYEEGEDVSNSYMKGHTLVYQGKAIW